MTLPCTTATLILCKSNCLFYSSSLHDCIALSAITNLCSRWNALFWWSIRNNGCGAALVLANISFYCWRLCTVSTPFAEKGCMDFFSLPGVDVKALKTSLCPLMFRTSPPAPWLLWSSREQGLYNYRLHLTWTHQTPPRREYLQIAFWVCLDEITDAVTRVKCQYCCWKACMCVPLPSNSISTAFQPCAISIGHFMGWNSERNFMANQGQVYMLSKTAFVAKWSERGPWSSSELTCFVCTDLWWCYQPVSSAADWSSCQTQTAWTRRDTLLFYSLSNKWS